MLISEHMIAHQKINLDQKIRDIAKDEAKKLPRSSGGGGGGIEEAPKDGNQYARKDQGWTEVTSGLSQSQADALYLGISAKAADSAKLNGQSASYYATAGALSALNSLLSGISVNLATKVSYTSATKNLNMINKEIYCNKLGVGTASPIYNIHLSSDDPELCVNNTSLSFKSLLSFRLTGSDRVGLYYYDASYSDANLQKTFRIYNDYISGRFIVNNFTNYLFGTDTTTAESVFHFARNSGAEMFLKIQNLNSSQHTSGLHICTSVATSSSSIGVKIKAKRTDAVTAGDTNIELWNSEGSTMTKRMTIASDGKVTFVAGNGTPILATGAKLTVDDVITALQTMGIFKQS